jgi:tripartite-type tricarboxylate transporter receptor subunit TctC
VLGESEVRAALSAQGLDTEPGTPDALRSRIAGDIERWRTVAAAAGIQPE